MSEALGTWIDGVAASSLPADDRGLQYGDGVFETILLRDGKPRFLEAHLARLQRGLARLSIPFPAAGELQAEIARAAVQAPPRAILKVVVTRGSTRRRGYAPAGFVQARRIVSLWETAPLDFAPDKGVELRIARLRLPELSALAGIKHLNRLENVLAAAEDAAASCFDALMLDTASHVISGTACNVFIVKSGGLLTPPVDRIGIAGVMRSIVLREAPRLGIAAGQRSLTLADLHGADGMFITNARIGVVPVRRVGEHVVPMSPVVARLAAHIETLDA